VGSQLDLAAAKEVGLHGFLLILIALCGRSIGTFLCTLGSGFTAQKKKAFIVYFLPAESNPYRQPSAPSACSDELA
jgi:hypothetical protein